MFVRITLALFLVSLAISALIGSYFQYFSNPLKANPEWIYSVSTYSAIICVVSLFVAIFAALIQDKRKSQGPIEEIHTFNLKELNDPQFTNDFSKVPGGEEIGITNTPRPPNYSQTHAILHGKEDLVVEDLAKIGIVDKHDEKK